MLGRGPVLVEDPISMAGFQRVLVKEHVREPLTFLDRLAKEFGKPLFREVRAPGGCLRVWSF